jgi:hypothetical protein
VKIELLYFDDCPNWQTTLEEIRNLLGVKGFEEKVDTILVSSNEEAERLQFPGSPTIRINYEDVDPEVPISDFQLASRIYEVDDKFMGKPPIEWIDAAIDAAAE